MKKAIFTLSVLLLCWAGMRAVAQSVVINANPGTSGNIAMGTLAHNATEGIYTETEIGAGNFTTIGTAITHYAVALSTLGTNTTFNNVNIYMKDVPLTTTSFTSGTYNNSGFTLVFSGSITFTSASLGGAWTEVALTTPFVRTAGNNLHILVTRTDGQTHPGFVFSSANGNNTSSTLTTSRRYNGSTAPTGTTSMGASAFRPAIRLSHKYANDMSVDAIYSLGKLPYPNGATQPISASISNTGTNAMNNVMIYLTISGANTFVDSQSISSLVSGADTVINFSTVTYTTLGTNTLTVTLPPDDDTLNNMKSLPQILNANTWSYAYGPIALGGVGFTGNTGNFVAKFNTNAVTYISQVTVNFTSGGNQYKIGIWDAAGTNGTPGNLIWESAQLTSVLGVNVLPVSPAALVNIGDFYVGVRQTGTTNVGFAYQSESPIRANTFYFSSPVTSTTWNDFAPNNPFRFMIEPKLILPVDISLSNIKSASVSNISCSSSPHSVTALLTNTGANNISIGTAKVTYKMTGANSFTDTLLNTKLLMTGDTELVTFSNISMPNVGMSFDTMYVELFGDGEQENDTQRNDQTILPTYTSLPITESYEDTTYKIGQYLKLSGNGVWAIQQSTPLYLNITPHSGNKFVFFDSYTYPSGDVCRLYSSCITLPPAATNLCNESSLGFWMTQDNSWSANLDSLYVSVSNDGGATWNRFANGYGRYNASFTTPGWTKIKIDLSTYAGQTIQIGFEAVSKNGNSIGVDDIMIGSNALNEVFLASTASNNNPLIATCDDNGWTYYGDPFIPNANLFAIQWDPNNNNINAAAKLAAQPYLVVDTGAFSVSNPSLQTATFTSKRYWNVNLGTATLSGPVNVRYFYDSSEIAQVMNRANAFVGTYGGSLEVPTWFKTISGSFMNDTSDMNENGVYNAMPLTNVNTTNLRVNGFPYAQFNGITSFSGGSFAAGVGLNSPLPLSLIDINVRNLGAKNQLNWSIANNELAAKFEIERSTDGEHFYLLGTVAPTSNLQHQAYSYYDQQPFNGVNYYRVKLMEKAGTTTYSKVVSATNASTIKIAIYPNPVKEEMNLQVVTSSDTKAEVLITDLTGKVLYTTSLQLAKGSNNSKIKLVNVSRGTYFIKVITENEIFTQKFDVQ
ncbi:MAG TPA: T9SS type A sorting domain-containing protein [Flavipsychrobacter sp.]|nr:T9SS type A sorting domain-containing protein [Flavipsychrobacter sp.]